MQHIVAMTRDVERWPFHHRHEPGMHRHGSVRRCRSVASGERPTHAWAKAEELARPASDRQVMLDLANLQLASPASRGGRLAWEGFLDA
jgi:hypothetical protein